MLKVVALLYFVHLIMKTSNPDIFVVDADYYRPELASVHLIRSRDEFALIDTGTQYSVANIERALGEIGGALEAVRYIVLTHIHLDHAGGAGVLMQRCPNAELVVHPRGAKHMVDPSKLIAGATAVYGEEAFAKLYGEIAPIDEARVIAPQDNDTLTLGTKTLRFLDTPGHASHHHCIVDESSNCVFTGDTLGIGYRAMRDEHHAFVCPTTSPVQFDPTALHASIDRLMALEPTALYLTHYSELVPTSRIIAGLHEQIEDYIQLAEQVFERDGNGAAELKSAITDYLVTRATNELPSLTTDVARDWLSLDADLNAQGLDFWWHYRRVS